MRTRTNLQVPGVDEPDFVKTDGRLFSVRETEIQIRPLAAPSGPGVTLRLVD